MHYLRKISRGKWPKEKDIAQATLKDIPADTVIAEFRTDHNRLSVWEAESPEDIDDAFVALASNMEGVETIFAIRLDSSRMSGFQFDDELGDTPAVGINKKHHNIVDLNYVSMGDVMKLILESLAEEQKSGQDAAGASSQETGTSAPDILKPGMVKRTKKQMKKLLADAYRKGKLDESRLSGHVWEAIKKECDEESDNECGQGA